MTPDAVARLAGAGATALAAGVLLLTACGGPRRPSLAAQVESADALVAEGCYRCLDEAVARYFALPPARGAAAARNDTKLFRALILLAVREKELGLDAAQHLKQAGHLVAHTTNPAAAREQLRWAELLPDNRSALSRDAASEQLTRLRAAGPEVEARLASAGGATDHVDVYLNVSLACATRFDRKSPTLDAVAAPALGDHVIQWAVAICGRDREELLAGLAGGHPRFVEADYWRGMYRAALAASPRARIEAREHLQAAHAAIPESPAIAFELAGLVLMSSARDALPLYESVTRRVPDHHEAWLRQGICLSYLNRSREAIAALTKVLELGRWFRGEALYWRAWNAHALGELDAAWSDIEEARKIFYNTDVYGLAGRIAHDRGEFDTARPLLEKAIELSDANCAAAWYLGLVHSARERWLEGGAAFEGAERCYRADVEHLQQEQRRAEAGDADAVARAAEIAAGIRSGEQQAALAAYNAAFNVVKGGDRDRARPLLDRAVTHPAVADRARELRAFVDR
jgi:tetratricopeptide (TPR) repeat protein